jgi:hypothetical protein
MTPMSNPPLVLSLADSQLDTLYAFAQPLDPDLRGPFREGIARLIWMLRSRSIG